MQNVCVLGATGSIGESTLDVIARHPDKYRVKTLTTNTRIERLIELAVVHQPDFLIVADESQLARAREFASQAGVTASVLGGADALQDAASDSDTDTIMAAIVGAAGLLPTLAAVKAGKKVLLANKESLVMSGNLFMQEVRTSGAQLLPIDSEHNAIFQCLPESFEYGQLEGSGISKILLTGSGGPFRETPLNQLDNMTPDQACNHPNWDMGRKISVDSATMMNKGLEFIEACWLFGVQPDDIQVVLHPQSVIHSMVQYADGSVLAQMGNPDMRTPIAHCLAYPQRILSGVKPLDFSALTDFSFTVPDEQRYPNLQLAIGACAAGQYATTGLNAANEIAVQAFLDCKIKFTDIYSLNASVLDRLESQPIQSIDEVLEVDAFARRIAQQQLAHLQELS